jgi:Domain of unknown function (DUF5668)
MNSKNVFSGGILILLGVLFLGKELDWFNVDWHEIFRLWPLLLIYLGLVAVLGKSSQTSTVVTVVLLCIAIPTVIVRSCSNKVEDAIGRSNFDFDSRNDDDDNNDEDMAFKGTNQKLSEPMDAAIKSATLEFQGGAAEFDIKETSSQLAEADATLNFGNISLKKSGDADSPKVEFTLNGKTNKVDLGDDNHNKVNLKLNPDVIWDMNFEFGAGKADFDLSAYKVKNLSIKTGLTETDVKVGDKADNLDVKVESGLTDIEFQVPQTAGCRIDIDGGLNDKDFDGFIQKNGHWETPDYDKAAKKITIKFEGGLQSLKVSRY